MSTNKQYSFWDSPIESFLNPESTLNGSGVIPGLEHLVKKQPVVDDVKLIVERKDYRERYSKTRKVSLG